MNESHQLWIFIDKTRCCAESMLSQVFSRLPKVRKPLESIREGTYRDTRGLCTIAKCWNTLKVSPPPTPQSLDDSHKTSRKQFSWPCLQLFSSCFHHPLHIRPAKHPASTCSSPFTAQNGFPAGARPVIPSFPSA
jgi:hypothetical protein